MSGPSSARPGRAKYWILLGAVPLAVALLALLLLLLVGEADRDSFVYTLF